MCMQSCIHSVDQALECCNEIGYPVMLKASWGGGGKGIRKCMNADDVRNSLKQVFSRCESLSVRCLFLQLPSKDLSLLVGSHSKAYFISNVMYKNLGQKVSSEHTPDTVCSRASRGPFRDV